MGAHMCREKVPHCVMEVIMKEDDLIIFDLPPPVQIDLDYYEGAFGDDQHPETLHSPSRKSTGMGSASMLSMSEASTPSILMSSGTIGTESSLSWADDNGYDLTETMLFEVDETSPMGEQIVYIDLLDPNTHTASLGVGTKWAELVEPEVALPAGIEVEVVLPEMPKNRGRRRGRLSDNTTFQSASLQFKLPQALDGELEGRGLAFGVRLRIRRPGDPTRDHQVHVWVRGTPKV